MSKDDTLEEVEFVGPGEMLKVAREKQGLTLDDVADKLHLRVSIIAGLEDDQYSTEISATFTKGYLKLYSKLLGLDDKLVLDAYKKLGKLEKEPAKLQSFSKKVARQASDQRLMMVTYLVLAIVIALVIAWWLQQDEGPFDSIISRSSEVKEEVVAEPTPKPAKEDTQTQDLAESFSSSEINNQEPVIEEPDSLTESALDQNDTVEAAEPDSIDAADIQQETEAPIESETVATENANEPELVGAVSDDTAEIGIETSDISAQNNEPEQDAVDSFTNTNTDVVEQVIGDEATTNLGLPVDLVFQFAGDCWMKLTDATGEDVAYGIKKSGRVMPVSGIPPFEVVLGAPEVVQISYQGEPVDMTQFRAGYTARFTLPLTQ